MPPKRRRPTLDVYISSDDESGGHISLPHLVPHLDVVRGPSTLSYRSHYLAVPASQTHAGRDDTMNLNWEDSDALPSQDDYDGIDEIDRLTNPAYVETLQDETPRQNRFHGVSTDCT